MKISILLLSAFFLSLVSSAQRMSDVELSQKIHGIVNSFIKSYDLSEQSPAEPKCERYSTDVSNTFVSLFRNSPDEVQIPNLFSNSLIDVMTGNQSKVSGKQRNTEIYVSLNDYIVKMREDQNLSAFTFVPEEKTLVINYLKKNRRVSGNLLMSVVGFEFSVKICRQENEVTYDFPVELTFLYEQDSIPEIEKVTVGHGTGQWNYDFYISPYGEYSIGNLNFKNQTLDNLESNNHSFGFGALLMLNIPGRTGNLSKYIYSGVKYRNNVFMNNLDSLKIPYTGGKSPFDYADGIVVDGYIRNIDIRNLKEVSSLGMITVPLGITIDYKLGKIQSKRHIFINPSVEIGIPLNYTTKYTDGNADYVGQYSVAGTQIPKFEVIIDEGYDFGYDFPLKPNNLAKTSKILILGEFEMGYKYFYNKSWSLNLSGFVNYSFTNLFSEQVGNDIPLSLHSGECYSIPYLMNPTRTLFYGLKLSIHSFAFQLKSKSKSIENVK